MYAINVPVSMNLVIKVNASPPTAISLLITAPDGTSVYDLAGTAAGAIYVAPSGLIEGSYTFSKTFATSGVWKIILADGASGSSFIRLHDFSLSIQESDPDYDSRVEIDPTV